MRVKYLDRSAGSFLRFSLLLAMALVLAAAFLILAHRFSSIETYNIVLFTLAIFFIGAALFFSAAAALIYHVYHSKKIPRQLLLPSKIAIKSLMPFILAFSGTAVKNSESLRKFYIEINNIFVESMGRRYPANEIMLLLPHCLQYSGCDVKLTSDINNCRECGRCCISSILKLSKEYDIEAHVVTGGTAARNTIGKDKPGIVLSVACERDLSLGIADVGSLPVIGVLNERPFGPCKDTNVNITELRDKLDSIIDSNGT